MLPLAVAPKEEDMAEVYKPEGSKFWYYDFTVKGHPRQRGSTRRTNKKEAKKVADELEHRFLDKVQLGEADVLTLAQALEFYRIKHQNGPRPEDAVARINKILGRVDGIRGLDPNLSFHELTYTMLFEYQQQRLSEGAAKQTINHEINLISAAYNIVSHDYKVRANLKFPRFKIEAKSRHLLDHEVEALLAELDPLRPLVGRGGTEYTPAYALGDQPVILEQRQQNYDLVICLLDTGLRMGELAAVTWDLVDTESWTFRIDRTKNKGKKEVSEGGWMIVHPTQRMRAVLERRYENRGNNPYLFPKWQRLDDGRWLREAAPQTSTKAIRRAMDKIGINSEQNIKRFGRRDVRSLRDTFATRLADRDVGIDMIQDLLGHATPTMTRKYADVKVGKLSKRAASILDEAA